MALHQRKKLSILFAILTLISLVIIVLSIMHVRKNNQYLQYKDAGGISFKLIYPKNWTVAPYTNDTNVVFYSPLENALDRFKDNVNIDVQSMSELKEVYSLNKYTKKAINQIQVIYKENFILEESIDTTLDGNPAHQIVFIGKRPGIDLKVRCIWTIKDDKVYIFTFAAVDSQYDKYLKIADTMLRSFKIP